MKHVIERKEPTNVDPHWECSTAEITDGLIQVVRFGYLELPKGFLFEGLNPNDFTCVFVRGKVPVTQLFTARDGHQSLLSTLVIDFEKLKEGDYDWQSVAFEDLRRSDDGTGVL